MRSLLLSALALLVPLTACNRRDEDANADQAVVARTSEMICPPGSRTATAPIPAAGSPAAKRGALGPRRAAGAGDAREPRPCRGGASSRTAA